MERNRSRRCKQQRWTMTSRRYFFCMNLVNCYQTHLILRTNARQWIHVLRLNLPGRKIWSISCGNSLGSMSHSRVGFRARLLRVRQFGQILRFWLKTFISYRYPLQSYFNCKSSNNFHSFRIAWLLYRQMVHLRLACTSKSYSISSMPSDTAHYFSSFSTVNSIISR